MRAALAGPDTAASQRFARPPFCQCARPAAARHQPTLGGPALQLGARTGAARRCDSQSRARHVPHLCARTTHRFCSLGTVELDGPQLFFTESPEGAYTFSRIGLNLTSDSARRSRSGTMLEFAHARWRGDSPGTCACGAGVLGALPLGHSPWSQRPEPRVGCRAVRSADTAGWPHVLTHAHTACRGTRAGATRTTCAHAGEAAGEYHEPSGSGHLSSLKNENAAVAGAELAGGGRVREHPPEGRRSIS